MLPRETDTDVFIRSQNIKNSQLIVDILITFTFTHQTLRYIVCSYFKGKSINIGAACTEIARKTVSTIFIVEVVPRMAMATAHGAVIT